MKKMLSVLMTLAILLGLTACGSGKDVEGSSPGIESELQTAEEGSTNENMDEIPNPKIVHYNLFFKPWHFKDVQYGDYFWKVAKTTPYYDELKKQLADFTDEDRQRARDDLKKMADKVKSIEKEKYTWAKVKKTEDVRI